MKKILLTLSLTLLVLAGTLAAQGRGHGGPRSGPQLTDEQKTVLILRDVEGMEYNQIAKILGVELGTVKSRISRARGALKQILEGFLK